MKATRIQTTMQRVATVLLLTMCALQGYSQGSNRKVTFAKFVATQNVDPYAKGFTGMELQFDVLFNWNETDFFKQTFELSYRMEQSGQVILRSENMEHKSGTIMAHSEGNGKSMAARTQKVFIPYIEIPLESGEQKADLIFSLSNGDGTYTDCFKTAVSWTHRKIVRHSLNEQVFQFQNFAIDYNVTDFGSNAPGMRIQSDISLKYGPQECIESQYELALMIRSAGKTVYDSRQSTSLSDKTHQVPVEMKSEKPGSAVSFLVKYYDLNMEGPAEVELVYVLLGAEGGPKEVFAHKMLVNAPPKYNFQEQVFTLQDIKAVPTIDDGVQGIAVHYSVAFKFTGILRNPEKGNYYFYVALLDDNGKLAVDPARAPKQSLGTAHLLDGQLPSPTNTSARGRIFIPYYMLTTAPGNQTLKYALMVSDVSLATKFPVVGQGKVEIQKPAEKKYWVALEQLEMIDANYDVEFIPPGTHLPELQYLLCVGEDAFFESDYNKNCLTAIPGSVMLRVSDGDQINMKLYDVDSGFFNDNDLQGKWKIDYQGKASPFLYEVHNQGQVVNLVIKVEQR